MQLRDMVLRAAARYNLPIRWLPDRLAEQNFAIQEPPSKASPWVRVLMGHLQSLRQRLDSQQGLTPADVTEVSLGNLSTHSRIPYQEYPIPRHPLGTSFKRHMQSLLQQLDSTSHLQTSRR